MPQISLSEAAIFSEGMDLSNMEMCFKSWKTTAPARRMAIINASVFTFSGLWHFLLLLGRNILWVTDYQWGCCPWGMAQDCQQQESSQPPGPLAPLCFYHRVLPASDNGYQQYQFQMPRLCFQALASCRILKSKVGGPRYKPHRFEKNEKSLNNCHYIYSTSIKSL